MVIKLCMKRHFLMKDMWSIDLWTILWEKGLRFYIWNLVSINLSIFLIVIFFKWQLVSKCFKLYCENMDNGWNKQNWQWKYIIKFHPLFIKFPHPYAEVGILFHCPTFFGEVRPTSWDFSSMMQFPQMFFSRKWGQVPSIFITKCFQFPIFSSILQLPSVPSFW